MRKAVVVLPFVPVTPTTRSRAVGRPWKAAASGPIAARTLGTTTSGTPVPSGRSHTSAAAPRRTASAANTCPSTTKPGTQKKSVPGVTPSLRYASPAIGTSSRPGSPGGAAIPAASSSSRSVIGRKF